MWVSKKRWDEVVDLLRTAVLSHSLVPCEKCGCLMYVRDAKVGKPEIRVERSGEVIHRPCYCGRCWGEVGDEGTG